MISQKHQTLFRIQFHVSPTVSCWSENERNPQSAAEGEKSFIEKMLFSFHPFLIYQISHNPLKCRLHSRLTFPPLLSSHCTRHVTASTLYTQLLQKNSRTRRIQGKFLTHLSSFNGKMWFRFHEIFHSTLPNAKCSRCWFINVCESFHIRDSCSMSFCAAYQPSSFLFSLLSISSGAQERNAS